jgi:hypothetical protein
MAQQGGMFGRKLPALGLTVLGAVLLASAVTAEERWPGSGRGGASDPYPSAAAGWPPALQETWEEEFERGYRAGRADERARGAAWARPNEFRTGLAWNDVEQSEAEERLERAAAELRRAVELMGRRLSLPRVQGALLSARDALARTERALDWLPELPDRAGERRYERIRGIGPERASGGWEG